METLRKAGYVYRMVEKLNRSVSDLASMLNTSEDDVQTDIDSYSTMQSNGVKDITKYSYFKEYFKDSRLREKERKDSTFRAKFVQWVIEDQILVLKLFVSYMIYLMTKK